MRLKRKKMKSYQIKFYLTYYVEADNKENALKEGNFCLEEIYPKLWEERYKLQHEINEINKKGAKQ